MRCETYYRFLDLFIPFFPFFGDCSVLAGHVYSALSEEMPTGAGRAVTLGIRALGCVVNLGKVIRERYYTYMRARICDYFDFSKLVFKAI